MARKLILGVGLAGVVAAAAGCTSSSSAVTTPVGADEYKKRMQDMPGKDSDYKSKTSEPGATGTKK